MLYKQYHDKDDKWKYTEWRYFCECTSPDHVLCFTIDEDEKLDIEISIHSNPYWSFWRRVKEAFRLLFKGDVCYLGVMINDQDRKELSDVLRGEEVVS